MREKFTFLSALLLCHFSLIFADDVCDKPKDIGNCRGLKPAFFFNSVAGRCELFMYGGCGGNDNRFVTLKECHDTCKHKLANATDVSVHIKETYCLLPTLSNTNIQCSGFFRTFAFNVKTLKCEPYIYGGCFGTKNLFNNERECQKLCFIKDSSGGSRFTPGLGRGVPPPEPVSLPDVADSTTTEPNASSLSIKSEEICALPPVLPKPFACSAFFKKWTFNKTEGVCKTFIYGGCHGTANLFDNEEECKATCINNVVVVLELPSAEVCSLPLERGSCKALKPKYGFNKETKRCEKFAYGGCEGNANNFESLEDCVNLCGGHEPQESLICQASTCNNQDAMVYRAKGCQPILKKGECCPSSWDCSAWDERLRNPDKCFWANENFPSGKFYEQGDSVDEASDAGQCRMVCMCGSRNGEGDIICATPGCYWPGLYKDGKKCATIHNKAKSCCPAKTVCDEELESLHKCKIDDKTYYAGEKMYPKEDPCRVCLCNETFTGQADDTNNCYTMDCGLNYGTSKKLKDGCQPVFKEGVCCPQSWICPEPEVETVLLVPSEPSTSSMVICPPGVGVRPGPHLNPLYPPSEGQVTEPKPASEPSDVCLLPKTLGPCNGFHNAWYFDMNARHCKQFKTGGPGSGGNLFETESDCKTTCAKYSLEHSSECKFATDEEGNPPNIAMPLIMCMSEKKLYRFNKKSGKCEDFLDPTCGRFSKGYSSISECEANCVVKKEDDNAISVTLYIAGKDEKCNVAPAKGRCKSRLRRFYYDTETGKCNQFWYGGCNSNGNNFKDERECIETCVNPEILSRAVQPDAMYISNPCMQEGAVQGPCRALKPRAYFDVTTSTCRMFFYGGCQGNNNNFKTIKDCEATCPVDSEAQANLQKVCELPKQAGNCRASKKRYFYNTESRKCEKFTFSGCGENENNFQSRTNCKLECELPKAEEVLAVRIVPAPEAVDDPCLLPSKVGICRAAFKRFYFDKDAKECKQFIFGGCQGNKNNFLNLKECEDQCAIHLNEERKKLRAKQVTSATLPTNPICSQPLQKGPCLAIKPSFYYDVEANQCKPFDYGGCMGNENRFESKEACESACSPPMAAQGLSIALPPSTPKCTFGNESYNLGDLIRFADNRCRTCVCASPPDVMCMEKMCAAPLFISAGNSVCVPEYDADGCCQIGYTCKPNPDEPEECSERICISMDFAPKPNQECIVISDGCCDGGIVCTQTN